MRDVTKAASPCRSPLLASLLTAVCLLLADLAPLAAETSPEAAWEALTSGGHIAVMRHALAPGIGDPPGFRLDDCATQRLLSVEGWEQARRLGQMFREHEVVVDRVYSSQWCRCLETARLMEVGPVEALPMLNSFFEQPEQGELQTAALRAFLAGAKPRGALVLVTHQVNITALTGVFPDSGEIVVVRPRADGAVEVVGRIPPP